MYNISMASRARSRLNARVRPTPLSFFLTQQARAFFDYCYWARDSTFLEE